MSIVQKLTEGIVNRDLSTEGAALISKWENTGLLEGMGDDTARNGMARLLENQAKELLREASTMQGGDVEGFAAVAFPLVRRVFGSLIANELVSVQPMSLPSGLIFFLDFTTSQNGAGLPRVGWGLDGEEQSLYGGGIIGSQLTGGVSLDGNYSKDPLLTQDTAEAGPYALNQGYASPTSSAAISVTVIASGTVGDASSWSGAVDGSRTAAQSAGDGGSGRLVDFDPDLSGSFVAVGRIAASELSPSTDQWNSKDFVAVQLYDGTPGTTTRPGQTLGVDSRHIRRLTRLDFRDSEQILLVMQNTGSAIDADAALAACDTASYTETDNFDGTVNAVGSVVPTTRWGLENEAGIPEIDIKVDSVAVTAITKKLKAKWTPELGQDLNAYHNLDAEVELTQILSEQIALEIDREILEDLVRGATAGVRYWSRAAGRFVERTTGEEVGASTTPDFTGNVSEWYETLIETINDVSAQIHRKTLRGAANFIVCSPEVANILEFTAGFRANVTADSDRGDAGAVKVGSLSKKFDIMVDPYFPRNLILVGRRGSSFLESGYVYAPYVPLQTTPTIFGVEDFVPRKGVMTRYAKKMVRPDMYGLVVVRDLT